MKPVKRVAVIHDLSVVGKAALTNIIPVLSVMGVEVCPIPTMILSTHTGGFGVPEVIKLPRFIDGCNNHYKKIGITFDTLFVGYLGSEDAIKSSIDFINENKGTNVVLDPIFGDGGLCYSNFTMEYVNSIKKLIPFSDIITPNYTEACFLTGEDYNEEFTEEKLIRIYKKLLKIGAKKIVITSIPSYIKNHLGIGIFNGEDFNVFYKEKSEKSYPGTGDIFTSVLIGKMINGLNLYDSALCAHYFVSSCIVESSKYDYPTKEGVLLEKNLKLLL
ncbi:MULTISPECIES: pyridoxamine kinase [Clostridium]|uniref:pyridoxal kinase n=1 Tax=Clostridium cibarium TaxID=2762247 RepID=A0ABR8PVX1_9CLOT|nr:MULTISPECIES: pyridoxamine kinase [Clostridium]MBD7912321.1 pyridoxamine kinase [Clostridium cibarium]